MSIGGPLTAFTRLFGVLGAWLLLFLASPGVVWGNGSALLATAALVPWSLVASRPGKHALWIEWLAAGVGLSASCFWTTKVLWITLLVVAIVPAFYMAVAGVVLRRLTAAGSGWPLWIATPAAWVGLETLRYAVDPPFGFGWLRLGHHAHHVEWLAASARVWGTGGISFVLAALAGGVADAIVRRGLAWKDAVAAVLPLAVAIVAGFATSPPATEVGPRVLLVQPAFEQRRKMTSPDWRELLSESIELTAEGLAEARAKGEREPDLVAWGESMFPFPLCDDGLEADYAAGARTQPWAGWPVDAREIAELRALEREVVAGWLFGASGGTRVLPERASFVSGADLLAAQDGVIRRWNAVLAWDPSGKRLGWTSKIHLVPGGETMCGLERVAWVRDTAKALANYVPDLASRPGPNVLALPKAVGGGVWRIGVTVCFDNAFEDAYARPVREGPLDLHLVCSNEAWYEESFEYDQMLAMARLVAIATGRSVVRATNAGISVVFDPSGRELARLEVGGKDRMVRGTLRADVPVPAEAERASRTPFVRLEKAWVALWIALPIVLLAVERLRRRRLQVTAAP